MKLILNTLEKLGRKRVIPDRDGDEDYLDRYYLWKKSDGKMNTEKPVPNNFNVYIHQFLKSDEAGLFHDHPWDFVSVILTDGYYEHTPEKGRVWHGPGSIIRHKATDLHWVELKPGTKPVTLFIHFKKKDQPWGFLQDNKIIPHKEFLERYRGKAV